MNLFLDEVSRMCRNIPDNVSFNDPAAPWNDHEEGVDQELVEEALDTAEHLQELIDSIDADTADALNKLDEIIDILKGLREEQP